SLIDPTTFLATLKSFPVTQVATAARAHRQRAWGESIVALVVSGLLYLHKVELDRGCAAEDRDENAHLALFGLDFLDGAVEVLERAVNDFDRLADLEQHLGLGPQRPFFHLLLDLFNFGHRNFGRIGGMSDEAGDFRRVLDYVPGLVVEHHLHEDVAGEKLAAGNLARAALAEFLHALDRHQHLADFLFLVKRAHPLLERGLGLVLVARVGMDDIPFHRGLGGFGHRFGHFNEQSCVRSLVLAEQHLHAANREKVDHSEPQSHHKRQTEDHNRGLHGFLGRGVMDLRKLRPCFGDETYALIEVTFQTIHFSCLNQEPLDYFGLNRSHFWRASQDSNLEPSDLESDALPIRATDPFFNVLSSFEAQSTPNT